MESEIFKKSIIDYDKLLEFGFIKQDKIYVYQQNIKNDSFKIIIEITDNKIKGKIIDLDLNEEYFNYRVDSQGNFSNEIREIYVNLLNEIKEKCTTDKYFVNNQSNRIAKLINTKFKDNPQFLFDENTTGVFKNSISNKWYGIIMNISLKKLGLEEDKKEDVLNVKLNEDEILKLLNKKGYYKAYHMNKKSWITIVLNDEIDDNEIMNLIEESYSYTISTNEWVVPANSKYFDVMSYFSNNEEIIWKQTCKINIDDIVYIYIGEPYSSIMFKTKAVEVNINDSNYDTKLMKLKLLKNYQKEKYTFKIIKEYGLTSIRGTRKMPKLLLDKMKEYDD